MHSIWTIFTETKTKKGADKILNQFLSNIKTEVIDMQIEKDSKGGYKIRFQIEHIKKKWNDIVIECISLGQKVGYEWNLYGDVFSDPSALTIKSNLSGIKMIEWQLKDETKN